MDIETDLSTIIFDAGFDFEKASLHLFRFQYHHNPVYQKYVDALGISPDTVQHLAEIPFLPVRLFKTHAVTTTHFKPELVFESSGTTHTINSRHFIKDAGLYEKSFFNCFQGFYGQMSDWCILGLLPSYLERKNSSLVYMVQKLAEKSKHPLSGFYLNDFDKLANTLNELEAAKQKTLLMGVTFALLDFAEQYPIPLQNTVVMETGGMKGRRKEMLRVEVHEQLKTAFALPAIHSEYGMSELLSQAYSNGNGLFRTPQWMRIFLRDESDPLGIKPFTGHSIRGLINVIDLANIYSCAFIATDDLGILYPDGSFEVTGRMDNSDLRGCSLLAV